ncbi:hypothetical protein GBF38_020037, partial [Nibea albiflora]
LCRFTYTEDPDYGLSLLNVNGLAENSTQNTYWELLVKKPDNSIIRPDVEYLSTVTDPKLRKSDYVQTIEKGCHRQTWPPREDRLCTHCTQHKVETELHFLTTCQLYQDIRDTYFPQITNTQKDFETLDMSIKFHTCCLKYSRIANIAAGFVNCCDHRRTSSGQEGQT